MTVEQGARLKVSDPISPYTASDNVQFQPLELSESE